ncbi:putative N-acetyltransferase [Rhypophila decipiens]|uniref:N-acetyltransferase n=1 Tax=Rhypophila decipiens TaxID=261697 RepID=A0AAN6XUA3_9PEZI|nr:putative N-acetyltransferase [Rhypophila decipiens]
MSQPTPTFTTTSPSSLIRLLQGITPLLSSFTTGLSLSLSVILVPRLLESPSPLILRQWLSAFHQGKKLIPGLSILSSLGYFLLSWWHFHPSGGSSTNGRLSKIYLLAGVATLSIVPYTRIIMWPTNLKLMAKEEEFSSWGVDHVLVTEEEEKGAKYLVDHWGLLNLGRAGLVGLAAVLGLGAGYI